MIDRPRRAVGLAVLAFLLTTLFLALTANPAAAAGDLIEVDPDSVVVEAPAPGRSSEWTMTARNVTDHAVPLALTVTGLEGTVFEGEHPLDLLVVGPQGDVLLGGGDVVVGQGDLTLDLPELPAGGEYLVHGRAVMPTEAGDEYRGAEGAVTLRFVATSEPGPGAPPTAPGGGLAATGAGITLLVTLAVVLIGAGTTAYVSTRKRRNP